MNRNNRPRRNATAEIIGIALLAVLLYRLMAPGIGQPPPDSEEASLSVAPPPANFALSTEGIKLLSPFIRDARLIPIEETADRKAPTAYAVEIAIAKEPVNSGAADWNAIAHDVRGISELLLNHPEPVRVRFSFSSGDYNARVWARAIVERESLPENWAELSYLKFFGFIHPEPATAESAAWLCAFYQEYQSARPGGEMPNQCTKP